MTTHLDSLSSRVQWLLVAAGLSARALDEAAGLPRTTTSRAVNGNVSENTLRAIAATLEVPVAWLRYGLESGHPMPDAGAVGARGAAIRLGGAL